MKYSILGFNQKAVLAITKDVIVEQKCEHPKYKTLRLDCTDLLILQDVADFMNRKKIIKYTVDDKIYFSIHYSAIIDDLPILGIKQQALSDRLFKLVELEMLEKTVIKNQSGSFVAFRLGEKYESIKYTPNTTNDSTSSTLHLQEYQTTSAKVVDYIPKYSYTNNSNTNNNNKEERDKSLSKKDDLFEECWKKYRRGRKSEAFKQWVKLTEKEKIKVREHIKYYLDAAESLQFVRHFERYLSKKTFNDIVVKGNSIIYDPEKMEDTNGYHPSVDGISIFWLEEEKMYGTVSCDLYNIFDGYDDDKRPASARLKRFGSTIRWDVEKRKWIEE